jgi:prepilin-type N-terminal cleavage/methylation domain-containing protein
MIKAERLSTTNTGFTLVELLVVLAIIGLLVSILLGALRSARQQGRQTICRNNLRQMGMALYLYQEASDKLPLQYDRWGPQRETYDNEFIEPWASYVAFHAAELDTTGNPIPLQVGKLYAGRLLETSNHFYCPDQSNQGFQEPYSHDYNREPPGKPWGRFFPTKQNGTPDDKIRVSYNYWLHNESRLDRLTHDPILVDTVQHWNTIAHKKGDRPQGLNAFFGDGHVQYHTDPSLFDEFLWNGGPTAGPWDGPGNDKDLFEAILARLRF